MKYFITNEALSNAIETQTGTTVRKFERRDFVAPLIDFCSDKDYRAILGIVFGLRSTGKTVGMLQAAGELIKQGHSVAYARFNYSSASVSEVNAEILKLINDGYTHFFLDEAPYLSGFLNESAEWADIYVPCNRIKIIISGTDSFLLWEAQTKSLFHRYRSFATNFCSYPEYVRVLGKGYEDFKHSGGLFTQVAMPEFIQTAVVDNLLNTIKHCLEDANRSTYYTDALYGINSSVVYKAVISILKCVAEDIVIVHFAENAGSKNIPALGDALRGFTMPKKIGIKERVAESVEIYRDFTLVAQPHDALEALIHFLVKVGCLFESITATSDVFGGGKTLYFSHNALMNYALEETRRGIENTFGIDTDSFVKGLLQASEGSLNENIVYAHLSLSLKGDEKIFRYRDPDNREIDAVIVSRKAKTVCMVEVKSKSKIDINRIASSEARHLLDDAVLDNIGIDGGFAVTRVVAYRGETLSIQSLGKTLLLVNIEDLLANYKELDNYLDGVASATKGEPSKRQPGILLQKLQANSEKSRIEHPVPAKGKDKEEPDIGD